MLVILENKARSMNKNCIGRPSFCRDICMELIWCTASGGALVAALIATRTDEELKSLLVPALAHRIRACEDSFTVWIRRWWRTGARFDTLEWARHCSW